MLGRPPRLLPSTVSEPWRWGRRGIATGHCREAKSEAFWPAVGLSAFLWALTTFFDFSLKATGVSHDSPEAQTCTFQVSGLQKHHQNCKRRPPREGRNLSKDYSCRQKFSKAFTAYSSWLPFVTHFTTMHLPYFESTADGCATSSLRYFLMK